VDDHFVAPSPRKRFFTPMLSSLPEKFDELCDFSHKK
jgi:hypothetical protein